MADGAVLQLTSSLGVGGAERLLIDYVTATAACSRGQVVIVMNEGESPDFRRELEASGRPVQFLGRRRGAPTPWTLLPILRAIDRHGAGVVHSHTGGSRTWSYLAKLARPSLKLVHTIHNMGIAPACSPLQRRLHRSLIDANVAISDAVGREGEAAGLKRVTVIENGVALARFRRSKRGAGGHPLHIACVARIAPQKGQDILIEALAVCRDRGAAFTCRLIGDAAPADAAYALALRQAVDRHGLSDRVRFVTGRTDVAELLAEADMFVLPSRYEGFGLALIEAVAAGLPAIVSALDGPAQILAAHPHAAIGVEPQSASALADAILRVIDDPDLRRRLSEAGPRAAQDYGIEKMAARYEALYASL